MLSAPAQAATAGPRPPRRHPHDHQESGPGAANVVLRDQRDGDIFGSAIQSGSPSEEGFLLKAGSTTLQFLGSPGDPGNTKSIATPDGLNVADDIACSSQSLTNSTTTPLLWPNSSTPSSLASLPAIAARLYPQATAINDSNLIAGDGFNGHGTVPFTIQGSQVTTPPPRQAGRQPAGGVSNAGVIVGQADSATISPVAVELRTARSGSSEAAGGPDFRGTGGQHLW